MNQKQKLINLVDELGIDYDNLPNQKTYEKICKLLGTNQYKIYSDQFPDSDPDIEKI
jgi:hypothetical protein